MTGKGSRDESDGVADEAGEALRRTGGGPMGVPPGSTDWAARVAGSRAIRSSSRQAATQMRDDMAARLMDI